MAKPGELTVSIKLKGVKQAKKEIRELRRSLVSLKRELGSKDTTWFMILYFVCIVVGFILGSVIN